MNELELYLYSGHEAIAVGFAGVLEERDRVAATYRGHGPLTDGWAGEVLALAVEHGLGGVDDAWRISTPDSPVPYSPPLEDAHLPGAERIAAEIASRLT